MSNLSHHTGKLVHVVCIFTFNTTQTFMSRYPQFWDLGIYIGFQKQPPEVSNKKFSSKLRKLSRKQLSLRNETLF